MSWSTRRDDGAGHASDPFDDWVRQSLAPLPVEDGRLDRLIGSVEARLDRPPARRPRPGGWRPALLRFAVPAAAGLALGVLVSRQLDPRQPVTQFSDMLLSTSFLSLDL